MSRETGKEKKLAHENSRLVCYSVAVTLKRKHEKEAEGITRIADELTIEPSFDFMFGFSKKTDRKSKI